MVESKHSLLLARDLHWATVVSHANAHLRVSCVVSGQIDKQMSGMKPLDDTDESIAEQFSKSMQLRGSPEQEEGRWRTY